MAFDAACLRPFGTSEVEVVSIPRAESPGLHAYAPTELGLSKRFRFSGDGENLTYRQLFRRQAERLAHAFIEGDLYEPFRLPC